MAINQDNEQQLETKIALNLQKLQQNLVEQKWENSINICEQLINICAENLLGIEKEKINPEKYTLLGDYLLDQGNIKAALTCYNYATELKEKLAHFYKKLGANSLEKKDFSQAINYFNRALEINPKIPENQSNLGSVYANLQQWEKAIYHYQEALKINPKLAPVYRNLARLFTKINQEKDANNCWYEAYFLEPNLVSSEEFYALGNKFFQENEQEKAILCLEKTLKLEPNHILAHDILGQIFTDQEASEKALNIYEKLGLILFNKKRYKESLEAYKRAIKFSKKIGEVKENLVKKYQETIDNYPETSPEDYFELGKLLRSQGNFNLAIDYLLKSINLYHEKKESHILLQYTHIEKRKLLEVIKFYQNLVTKYPTFELGWGNLGDFFTANKQVEKALECYQKSVYYLAIKKTSQLEQLTWPSPPSKGPDFLIIGTIKGGTTSLHGYLGCHPQVLLPHKKEIAFFNKYFDCGVDWYLSHFPTITTNTDYITGESTPAYLSVRQVETRTAALFPHTKLIVLLRNPVEQAISWHYHKINTGLYQKTLAKAMQEELKPINHLKDEQIIQLLGHQAHNLMSSLYYYHLKRWFKHFPREQFLILKSEDFFANTSEVIKEVYQFLGLSEYPLTNFPTLNTGYYPEISDDIKQQLSDYFRPHNEKLEKLLGKQFNWD